jgi:hypothetical protein
VRHEGEPFGDRRANPPEWSKWWCVTIAFVSGFSGWSSGGVGAQPLASPIKHTSIAICFIDRIDVLLR